MQILMQILRPQPIPPWRWDPANCILISPSGDFKASSSLKVTDFEAFCFHDVGIHERDAWWGRGEKVFTEAPREPDTVMGVSHLLILTLLCKLGVIILILCWGNRSWGWLRSLVEASDTSKSQRIRDVWVCLSPEPRLLSKCTRKFYPNSDPGQLSVCLSSGHSTHTTVEGLIVWLPKLNLDQTQERDNARTY